MKRKLIVINTEERILWSTEPVLRSHDVRQTDCAPLYNSIQGYPNFSFEELGIPIGSGAWCEVSTQPQPVGTAGWIFVEDCCASGINAIFGFGEDTCLIVEDLWIRRIADPEHIDKEKAR